MLKSLHPNIRMRIYTSFLSRVVGNMIFPFMAIYFSLKLNTTLAGILLTFQVIVQFATSLYGGYFADVIGRKKMMVFGETLKILAFIGMIAANSPWWSSPWMMYFSLLVVSISAGIVNPAADAMLIDVSTKETRVFMYSINYWAVNFSLMIGLIVGGWLFKTHLFELLISLLAVSIITFILTKFFIIETYVPRESTNIKGKYGLSPLLESYKKVIKDWPYIAFTLGGIAIFTIEFQRNNYIAVNLEQNFPPFNVSLFNFGNFYVDGIRMLSLITVENTILVILFAAIISKFVQSRSLYKYMYIGFVLFGLGYSLLLTSNNLLIIFSSVVILTLGELIFVPTRQSILAEVVNDDQRGAYMAFNGFVFQFGKMFGAMGIIVGNLIGTIGMIFLYILCVIIGIGFSYITYKKRELIYQKAQ
ncbi:MFS transporter [Virgibacillus sp. AGTR]|uniref:MDR family MFS transporter n=1 Tax=Virgibacillus sp. AGTR TaxID=2812055 RepID=UPI001D16DFC5|nr:MFS transporter [Virgibacillus sp. AGTR]MCC2252142.1 MFS transporter [Virgibacillus sp. AGTR]